MQAISRRFNYLFCSTKGLVLVAVALISLTTAIWGMLSGPMAEWGISDVVVRITGMNLVPSEREARIILLYHTIAMAVVALEVYLITDIVPMQVHTCWRWFLASGSVTLATISYSTVCSCLANL